MSVNKDEILKIYEQLPETARQSAYDYLQYLAMNELFKNNAFTS